MQKTRRKRRRTDIPKQVTDMITQLRAEGLKRWQIAQRLNEAGLLTPSHKRPWSPRMVGYAEMRISGRIYKPYTKKATIDVTAGSSTSSVITAILNTTLAEKTKLAAIKAIVEAR